MADDKLYYRLGQMNLTRKGTEVNLPKAGEYFEKAAELDDPGAMFGLGKLFLTGEVVTRNTAYVLRWLEESIAQENPYAGYLLGKLYLYGWEVKADQEKTIAYLAASAEMGNQYAGQLRHSIRNNRNWSAATGTLRLLHHISRIIQNRIADERKGKEGGIDRKLKRRIDEKKQAHGLRQG